MESTQPLRIPKCEWERHKDTIRRLYLECGMTLKEVMSHMSHFPFFDRATENMYKKRISLWKFDIKNHKLATIQEAASVRQRCRERGEEFRLFERTGHKLVTEQEFTRYWRRKQHTNLGNNHDQQAVVVPDDCTLQYDSHVTIQRTKRTCRCLKCQRIGRDAFLNRKRFVRLKDIVAPDAHRSPETFFRSYRYCLESSFSAGHWSLNKESNYNITRSNLVSYGFNVFGYATLFRAAGEQWRPTEFHSAGKIFTAALAGLLGSLYQCIPLALTDLFDLIFELLSSEKSAYAGTILRSISAMLSRQLGCSAALQSIFLALSSFNSETLLYFRPAVFELHFNFIAGISESIDSFWQTVCIRRVKISTDNSLEFKDQATHLSLLLEQMRQHPSRNIVMETTIMSDMAISYTSGHEIEKAKKITEEACQLVEIQLIEGRDWSTRRAAEIWSHLASLYDDVGDLHNAIKAQERGIALLKSSGDFYFNKLRELAGMQRRLKKEQEALKSEDEAETVIRALLMLELQDRTGAVVENDCEDDEEGNSQGRATERASCEELKDNEPITDTAQVVVDDKATFSSQWREGLSPTHLTQLTLPMLEMDDECLIAES